MGEARDDAPADQHDESDQCRHAHAACGVRCSRIQHLGMEAYVGGSEDRDKDEWLQVTPITANEDLPGNDQQEAGKKQTIEHHGREGAGPSGRKECHPCRTPEEEQEKGAPTGDRQTTGPIGHGRQKKTSDDSHAVPKNHLVGMPCQRAISFGKGPQPCERSDPKDHGDDGPKGGAKEERPEAIAEERNNLRRRKATIGPCFRLDAALHRHGRNVRARSADSMLTQRKLKFSWSASVRFPGNSRGARQRWSDPAHRE